MPDIDLDERLKGVISKIFLSGSITSKRSVWQYGKGICVTFLTKHEDGSHDTIEVHAWKDSHPCGYDYFNALTVGDEISIPVTFYIADKPTVACRFDEATWTQQAQGPRPAGDSSSEESAE